MVFTKTIIRPQNGLSLGLKELWQYRELFYFFTWRDIKVKYKQTYLGVFWAILQPVLLIVLFTFIFSKSLNFSSGGVRYEIFVLSGLILWNLFYATVSHASESILQQSNLIRKVYFPRLIIPCSSLLVALFDFFITFILFLVLSFVFGQSISLNAFFLYPVSIILVCIGALGIGILMSSLTVKFRDFRYALPFLLQFLFFSSSVVYSLEIVKEPWLKYCLALNPVNGAIELFRFSFGVNPDFTVVFLSCISSLLFILIGLLYFRKTEAYFADLT